LTSNPTLRTEVETARAWGVPHSILKGRVVSGGQPQWTAEDTALAVGLTAIEARACTCGHDRADTTKPEAEDLYQAQPIRCHACATRDRAAQKFADDGGSPAGLLWAVVPKQT
jgi:hypothetical protein